MKAIINARIYDYQNYIKNGFVIFDKEIIKVGDMKDFNNENNLEIIDFCGDLLLPSFVCAHSHIYSIFARGLSMKFDPKNFQDILDQMWWKLDAKLTNEITYYSGIAAASEFLLNGVTSVIDHHASGEIIDSLNELKKAVSDVSNMRGIYCFETSDRYNIKDCIKENATFALKNKSEKASGLFGMHASMSLSDETLKLIKQNQNNIPIHVHVAESNMDEEDSLNKYKTSIIERFDKFGIIIDDSLIVHGVFMNDKELDIIKKRNAYIVVNTTSNMNNAVGLPNVKAYLNKGIPVMVGNDGLNSNMASEYMNVYYTSHLFNKSPKELNLGDVNKMIQNSYEYVSKRLNIKLGKISEGFKADLLRVKYSPFTSMDETNAFGHIFFGLFPNFKPSDVYIDGLEVVKSYELVNKKLKDELKKANEYSSILWNKLN